MIRVISLIFLAVAVVGFAPSAEAVPIIYTTTLTGPAESPPNASPGTGFGEVDFDLAAHTMIVKMTFSGLLAGTTASHIHSPTALPGEGTAAVATTVPTFPGFPLGVTSGTYERSFDTLAASTYNPAFVTANGGSVPAAEAALAASLAARTAYLNIHTTMFPGGEIRGFLAVPEPATLLLLVVGGMGVLALRKKATG